MLLSLQLESSGLRTLCKLGVSASVRRYLTIAETRLTVMMPTTVESLELNELTSKADSSTGEYPQRISALLSEVNRTTAAAETLNQTEQNRDEVAADVTRLESSLGRVDGGFQAWSLVREYLLSRCKATINFTACCCLYG